MQSARLHLKDVNLNGISLLKYIYKGALNFAKVRSCINIYIYIYILLAII